MRSLAIALAAAVLVTAGLQWTQGREPSSASSSPSGSEPPIASQPPADLVLLTVGTPAPRVDLQDADGRKVELGGPTKQWTVVSFYRAALTPW